jgi:hypothetical protein
VNVEFEAELWTWDARRGDSWVFVSLPVDASDEIGELTGGERRGFGSVRVRVTIGRSSWSTSIFPDSTRGAYALPLKKSVRTAESLAPGDVATVSVELVDY